MLIALFFVSLASAFGAWAYALGGAGWLLLYPAVACGLVGLSYTLNLPVMVGKRADGSLPAWSIALYLPVYLGLWGRWHALRLAGLEAPWVRVTDTLWLGRRPLDGELPPEVELVVDLTGEWHRAAGLSRLPHRWLRCLDGMPFPDLEALEALVVELSADPRPMYVHCAAGHGRSATVLAALMIRRGLAADPRDAEVQLKKLRPRVHITRGQMRQLVELSSGLPRDP